MRQNFRTYPIALTAGQELEFGAEGDFYAVIEADSPFTITFDESNRINKAQAGTGGRFPAPYNSVKVQSDTAQTVLLVLGYGQFFDNRATLNATINTTIEPANTISPLAEVSIPGGGSAQIAAANANRKELRVGIKSDQPGGVYLGDVNVGALSPGGFIEQGGTDYISTESAVYAYNAGAASVVVNALSLERI